MRLKSLILLLLATYANLVCAQSISDTIALDEVTLYADYHKYQLGAKFESIDLNAIDLTQTSGLDQLLSRYSPIYIKTNAGGLATIKVRGTSPDHTSINFGGININSLTLGQSNVASIPSFLFDKLEMQYGSSSALNGSGAIGGALYLGLQNNWTRGAKIQANTLLGSFGEQQYGIKAFVGNGKFESVTRAYFYRKENNFPFSNKYTGNVEDRTPVADVQQGAALKSLGLLQEFNYLFNPHEFIKSMIWLDDFWYQIQPNMKSNLQFTGAEEMHSNNARIWTEYRNENKPLKLQLGAGYVHDFQLYNNTIGQEIITDRLIGEAAVKHTLSGKMEYRVGTKYKYIVPEVYAYSKENISNEQHLDLYGSWFWHPVENIKTTVNLRQVFVSNFNAPFTPSLGSEYKVFTNTSTTLLLNGNVARSYRIPTFNDRFWLNQGNANLRPEDGWNFESGVQLTKHTEKHKSAFHLNAFYMNVDDWIEWRNFGVWQARNVQKVISKGLEFHFDDEMKLGKYSLSSSLNYNINSAEKIEADLAGRSSREQLIYTPLHMGNLLIKLANKQYALFVDANFTGKRKTDYLGHQLPSYWLANYGASYFFALWKQAFTLSYAVNNLLNTAYENEKYYAMPGRSFRVSLSATIQTSNH